MMGSSQSQSGMSNSNFRLYFSLALLQALEEKLLGHQSASLLRSLLRGKCTNLVVATCYFGRTFALFLRAVSDARAKRA